MSADAPNFDTPCDYCGTMLDRRHHAGFVGAMVYHSTEYCRERLSERRE